MTNLGKLRLGSAKPRLGKNSLWTKARSSQKQRKPIGERTVNLPTAGKENQSTENETKDDKEE